MRREHSRRHGQFVIEGTACVDCANKRAAARARKLLPMALFAGAAALGLAVAIGAYHVLRGSGVL